MRAKRAPPESGTQWNWPCTVLCVVQCFSGENHSSHCNSEEQRASQVCPDQSPVSNLKVSPSPSAPTPHLLLTVLSPPEHKVPVARPPH